MATYASTTNPFIETGDSPTSPSRQASLADQSRAGITTSQRQVRKSIPGMARPQRSIDDSSKHGVKIDTDEDLLLSETEDDQLNNTISPNGFTQAGLEELKDSDKNNNNNDDDDDDGNDNQSNDCNKTITENRLAETKLGGKDIALIGDKGATSTSDKNTATGTDSALMGHLDGETSSAIDKPDQAASDAQCIEQTVNSLIRLDSNTEVVPTNISSIQDDPVSLISTKPKELSKSCANGVGRVVVVKEEDDEEEDDELDDVLVGAKEESSDKTKERICKPLAEQCSGSNRQQQQHIELMKKLRLQLRDLERYAYERGELEQVPPSILAERQSVILDRLRKKLSLNLDKDKIERLELEELKRQVDEEINQLIDPLITKEHLLNQLKTQLTDLERYISHLHGAIGKGSTNGDKIGDCSCSLHGCSSSSISSSSPSSPASSAHSSSVDNNERSVLNSETLPKTSRLIRGLMAQLICSDIKIQEAMKLESEFAKQKRAFKDSSQAEAEGCSRTASNQKASGSVTTKPPQFHDGAAWTLHIDRVTLAVDSLSNLFSLTPKKRQHPNDDGSAALELKQRQQEVDDSLIESVVRRQLVPAIRDLLAYGLIDPSTIPPKSSYASFLIDPYYLLTSFSCLPGSQVKSESNEKAKLPSEKVHVWNLLQDYYESRNEVNFRNSSVKTLSQSFNLTPSIDGPIKITSKQALLIAIDDILERLSKRKPNGPESHFRLFVYTALNQGKLATWTRLVFRNKAILKKYYHDFSFTSQQDKMDKFLANLEMLSQFRFNIDTDTESNDQFVSAF